NLSSIVVEDSRTTSAFQDQVRAHSRSDFRYDATNDLYPCPAGKQLRTSGTVHDGKTLLDRASCSNLNAARKSRNARSRVTFMSPLEMLRNPSAAPKPLNSRAAANRISMRLRS